MGTEEMVEKITQSLIASSYNFAIYGIRTDDREYKVGERVQNSYDQTDEGEGEELEGACATGFGYLWYDEDDKEVVAKALKIHKEQKYYGEHLYLIGGDDAETGSDEAEIIIKNAKVVAVII